MNPDELAAEAAKVISWLGYSEDTLLGIISKAYREGAKTGWDKGKADTIRNWGDVELLINPYDRKGTK